MTLGARSRRSGKSCTGTALSAMRIFKSFLSVTICSVVLSVVCAVLGLLLSILAGTPVGSTIVVTDMVAFGVFSVIGKLTGR